jgi:hypothetical protein
MSKRVGLRKEAKDVRDVILILIEQDSKAPKRQASIPGLLKAMANS